MKSSSPASSPRPRKMSEVSVPMRGFVSPTILRKTPRERDSLGSRRGSLKTRFSNDVLYIPPYRECFKDNRNDEDVVDGSIKPSADEEAQLEKAEIEDTVNDMVDDGGKKWAFGKTPKDSLRLMKDRYHKQ